MIPVSEIRSAEVRALAQSARTFVASQHWCERVTECVLAFAIAGVVGVFRIDLVPAPNSDADSTVWAVVGDLPPAYLVVQAEDTWQDVLRGYADEMEHWVAAARDGLTLDDTIPVNVPATPENAALLASRLAFLRQNLIDVHPDSVEGDA